MKDTFFTQDNQSVVSIDAFKEYFVSDIICLTDAINIELRKTRGPAHYIDGGARKFIVSDVVAWVRMRGFTVSKNSRKTSQQTREAIFKRLVEVIDRERGINVEINFMNEAISRITDGGIALHKKSHSVECEQKYLADTSDIIKNKMVAYPMCGIYFLILGSEIVYVGQSTNIMSRLEQHRRDKKFDYYSWIAVDKRDLDYVERFYINKLKPQLNGVYNSGAMYSPKGERK